MPRPYHHSPHWVSKAQRRVGGYAQPGSERWRRRITEKAYRLRVLGPPIAPDDTADWKEEEYRLLHYVDVNNGCRYWEPVNHLAKQDTDHRYKVAQMRYAAVRQRLINEGKLVRVSKGYKLLISDAGERRYREIAGVSKGAHPYKPSRFGNANYYDRVGTCGLVW